MTDAEQSPSVMGIPSAHSMVWDVVQALRELGGSGTIAEINEKVAELKQFTEEQQQVPAPRGNRSAVEYRLAWARTYAKNLALLENTDSGVWSLTRDGRSVTDEEVDTRKREYQRKRAIARKERKRAAQLVGVEADEASLPAAESEIDWQAQVLALLRDLDPIGFERLAQLLLRAAGFVNVQVTRRSGDGGIDGTGTYRLSLVSFPMVFQCKRYTDAVRSGAIRDFRGAMVGRADRGLFITTGRFTQDARAEATRDGARRSTSSTAMSLSSC